MGTSSEIAPAPPLGSLRILFAGERWEGSDALAYERAFSRAGHAVTSIDVAHYLPPGWRALWLRAVRRALQPVLVAEYEQALIAAAKRLKPQLFVGFKAPYATPRALREIKAGGAIAINVYPDISVMAHGPYLPLTLPHYDWIFTTKSFGVADMRQQLGITGVSFFPPAFDPEIHHKVALSDEDRTLYGADVSFVGIYQPKNEQLLAAVARAAPGISLKIWGNDWHKAHDRSIAGAIQGFPVKGIEYAKTIGATRINLAFLRVQEPGATSGDMITHRTFAMPACGGFILHERTPEVVEYFTEGKECAMFDDEEDLVAKVHYYLEHEEERAQIAAAGRAHALASGYSVDARITAVLAKYDELCAGAGRRCAAADRSC